VTVPAVGMTLRQQQSLFMRCLGQLITWAYANGYELTGRQLERSDLAAAANAASGAGIGDSLHRLCLAIDMELFKDGVFLQTTDDYRPLGEYWKTLDPLCCWGGDFASPDADHFSSTRDGIR
jgi:hypothetical protein